MTVGALIEILEDYDPETKIVMQGCNTMYADSIDTIQEGYGVRAFYGNDYKALVLKGFHQIGAIWDQDELFGDEDEEDEESEDDEE